MHQHLCEHQLSTMEQEYFQNQKELFQTEYSQAIEFCTQYCTSLKRGWNRQSLRVSRPQQHKCIHKRDTLNVIFVPHRLN